MKKKEEALFFVDGDFTLNMEIEILNQYFLFSILKKVSRKIKIRLAENREISSLFVLSKKNIQQYR